MLFNSLHFLIFFPLVVIGYFLIPKRYRWTLLLAASYYFYMSWKPAYLLLILFSTLVDYFAAIKMEESTQPKRRRLFLWMSLGSNLGLLFLFKYFGFFEQTLHALLGLVDVSYPTSTLDLLLPVGISFYTFQTLSYTIDVYQGRKKAERHLGIFALYVSFFPQLVAGPIERSERLLPQFKDQHITKDFDYQRISSGLQLMAWGLFKKVVIADRLAGYVNEVYGHPEAYAGLSVILATVFFAFQIYCDFSGYSDIAIGAAQVLGFDLMKNFDRPYFAKSIAEFWRRWHISLSTWFRDYVYINMGGNRVVKWRWYYNLMITFLVSGLWHGANWTFVIWGALHGAFLIVSIMTAQIRQQITHWTRLDRWISIQKAFQVGVTFTLVCIGWVFFRADTLGDALTLLQQATQIKGGGLSIAVAQFGRAKILFSLLLIGLLTGIHWLHRGKNLRAWFRQKPTYFRWAFYQLLILSILLFGVFEKQEFIYFQF
jgi:D-alanyl-lipoteichoic acid acyltransferase DltB (MBOAT superfamily)